MRLFDGREADFPVMPERQSMDEIGRLTRLHTTLSRILMSLLRLRSREDVFREVCQIATECAGFTVAWVGMLDPASARVLPVAQEGDTAGFSRRLRVYADDRPEGRGAVGTCVREGRTVVLNDFEIDPNAAPWREAAMALGLRSVGAFPLRLGGRTVGALAVYAGRTGYFGEREIALVEEIAAGVSLALDNLEVERLRREAEAGLSRSEDRYRSLVETSGDWIWEADRDWRYTYASPRVADLLGYTAGEVLGLTPFDLMPEEPAARARREFGRVMAERLPLVRLEHDHRHRTGRTVALETSGVPILASDGELVGYRGVARDISDRKLTERRQATQAAVGRVLAEAGTFADAAPRLLQVLVESEGWSWGAIWGIDPTSEAARLLDWKAAAGRDYAGMLTAVRDRTLPRGTGLPGRVLLGRRIRWETGEAVDVVDAVEEAAGRVGLAHALGVPVFSRGRVVAVIELRLGGVAHPGAAGTEFFEAIARQVGQMMERVQAQDERRQAQKMESLGLLAGGIAHDFNNLLAVIQGNTELAMDEVAPESELRECLVQIRDAAARARSLVKQILMFSRQEPPARRPLDLRSVLDEALRLLRSTLPARVDLTREVVGEPPPVLADPGQIQQILLNLGTNAWQAMEGRAGRITVRLVERRVDADLAAHLPRLRPGAHVCLEVDDSGKGMDEAVLPRIFEPFFTTKDPGKGTGLGLAVVHGLVELHDGAIEVASRPGEGTVFRIYLPAQRRDVAAAAPAVSSEGAATGATAPLAGPCAIVVDDEVPLLRVTERLLSRLGFRVATFEDPAEALRAFEAAAGRFDLAFLDLNMPGMSGLELAEALLRRQPGLPVLLNSGYISSDLEMAARRLGVRQVLPKPNTAEELGAALRRVMNPGPGASS